MVTPVLECERLTKSYGAKPVLKELDLTIPSGKIFGLLGPNGCGKSTLIKLVSGILVPDSGGIKICSEYRSEASNALVSYLPERPYFPSRMKVFELLDYFEDFYEDFDKVLAFNMLRDLKIEPLAPLRTLSKGTKEKVQLILVMARRARLYLLDEPIGGVDPAAREAILDLILKNYTENATVLMSTHLIHDIEPVLDRALMISKGKLVLNADVKQLKEEGKTVEDIFKEVFAYAW